MSPPSRDSPQWLRVTLPPPPAGEGFLLVDALHRLGARHITRREDRIVALLACHDPDPRELVADLRAAVRASTSLGVESIEWSQISESEIDEAWQRDVRPFQASPRLRVVPSNSVGPRDPSVLRLSPSLAFGTPSHPTTRSCLELLDSCVQPGERLVDVGTGSGILAIAAALLGAAHIEAYEADRSACRAAIRNRALNHVESRVEVIEARVTPESLRKLSDSDRIDGVSANLEPAALLPLIGSLARLPRPGGWILLSGVPRAELPTLRESLGSELLDPVTERVVDGWWTGLWVSRPRSPREPEADRPGH
ncbi:MAG: hypothetical protein EA351_09315 [Gemmatimonadales bacterium]|nr:MAG: hypothetical protein EA351_09315 [Gemmatimonadales bacterium]